MAATDNLPGHEVINPEGTVIRVPAFALGTLSILYIAYELAASGLL